MKCTLQPLELKEVSGCHLRRHSVSALGVILSRHSLKMMMTRYKEHGLGNVVSDIGMGISWQSNYGHPQNAAGRRGASFMHGA